MIRRRSGGQPPGGKGDGPQTVPHALGRDRSWCGVGRASVFRGAQESRHIATVYSPGSHADVRVPKLLDGYFYNSEQHLPRLIW